MLNRQSRRDLNNRAGESRETAEETLVFRVEAPQPGIGRPGPGPA
jgi:hypothetical protein